MFNHLLPNQYLIISGKHYRKSWRGDIWIYDLMEDGYSIETYTEEEFNSLPI